MKKLNWGILGTGMIARALAKAINESQTGTLLAVGSRSQATADKFGDEFKVARRYASYEALLADRDVQAVYISLPNHMHAEWAVKCAEAGKHILCEKPFTINHAEAMAVIEAVRSRGVFLMEAFMYRCHPQTAKLVELVRSGVIGELRVIQAHFSYNMGQNLANIRLQNEAAGGAIMDIGCYCMSMTRLIAGAEPVEIKGIAHIGTASRVDEYATAVVKFPGNILANLTCGNQVNVDGTLRIWGSTGHILVPNPWFPGNTPDAARIIVNRDGQPSETINVPGYAGLYTIEVDTVTRHLADRQAPRPAMTWDDTIQNMRALDLWRNNAGMVFDAEKPTASFPALPTGAKPVMKYSKITGVDKPVSRIVCGTMLEGATNRTPHAMRLFDTYFERGGNTFDTAWVYQSESYLGKWVRDRGVRKDVVIIAKGAATMAATPELVDRELAESLERFGLDTVEIYLMHRDNVNVPVGEFVDCLNRHKKAGCFQAFGGSNWTLARVQAANEYARQHNLTDFTVISNNFSLAEMVAPVWAGCVHVSDAASRAWLTQHQIANFAWSSQARGFFAGNAHPDTKSDAELVRCWYSPDNFRRLERVKELAAKRGVLPINIAAAYVLCQPFPSFALIGPHTLHEITTSLPALDITLTPDEMAWLNLER